MQSDNGKTHVLFDTSSRQAKLVGPDGSVLTTDKGQYGQGGANGNAYLGDWQKGLFHYEAATGKVDQIAPPGRIGIPFHLDNTGRYLVYQTFYTPGSSKIDHYTNAAVVLRDLSTGQEGILHRLPNQYVHALAWVGNRVLVQTWEDGPALYNVFKFIDLQGRSERLRDLEQAPLALGWPTASPSHHYLVYPAEEGMVVIHPASQKFKVYTGANRAFWNRIGLVLVYPDGTEQLEHPSFGG